MNKQNQPVVTLSNVDGLYDKWGYLVLDIGERISTKTGYLRHLMDICVGHFREQPELKGLKIKLLSNENPIVTALFFKGVWIKSRN